MKKLYITDLDGTFLNSNAELTEKSKKLISGAIDNGTLFSVATARTFATVTKLFENVSLKLPLVLMNGVMLYDPAEKSILSCHSIDIRSIKEVFETYKRHHIYPLVYRCKEKYLEIEYFSTDNPHQMKYINKRTDATGKRFVYSPSFSIKENDAVIYIVTLDKYEKILPLYEDVSKIKDISCVFYRDNYTDCYFLEIFASGVSKASAMLELKSIVGADRTVAFGDNLNDIEMFKSADEAYAVENACDELKKIATGVIGRNDDDAVSEYIYNSSEIF